MFNLLLIFLIFNSVVSCSQSEEQLALNTSIPSSEAEEMIEARKNIIKKHTAQLKFSKNNTSRCCHVDSQPDNVSNIQEELFQASVLTMQQARSGRK